MNLREKSFIPNEKDDEAVRMEKARKDYSDRYGNQIIQKSNWQKMSLVLSLCLFVSVVALTYVATKSQFIPYFIEVNDTTGHVRPIGAVTETNYKPSEAVVVYFLADVIKATRSVPLDPVVYRENWSKSTSFFSAGAFNKLKVISQEDGHLQLLGVKTVQPEIVSINLMANTTDTYQIRWSETTYSLDGGNKSVVNYAGSFTVGVNPPSKSQDILKNPIGLYIKDFSYTAEVKK